MATKSKAKNPKCTNNVSITQRLSSISTKELHNVNTDSENEDAKITVSSIELRNLIKQEVGKQLTNFNDTLSRTITELRNDLALRFDCIDNRVNETLTNISSTKRDLIAEINKTVEQTRNCYNEIKTSLTVLSEHENNCKYYAK